MPIKERPEVEAAESEFFWNYLPTKFPEEFKELCLIPPLRGDEDIIAAVQLQLGEIVSRYHRRFSEEEDYFTRVQQCIRSAESAATVLQEFLGLFVRMDRVDRNSTLTAANMIDWRFPERSDEKFIGQCNAIIHMMRLLGAAMVCATGVSAAKKGRGRYFSPYVQATREIMDVWESITAQPNPPFEFMTIKPAPTPRPFGKGKLKDQKPQPVEHSTAFTLLALRMIKSDITNSQVVTSMKHAVKQKREMIKVLEKARGKDPLLAILKSFEAPK
jgi:hypothetical protein